MPIGAGERRHLIAFEKRVDAEDGYGNTRGAFAEQFQLRAKLQAKFGGEAVSAARLAGEQPVVIVVRRCADSLQVTPAWRARNVRTGEIYNIRSIADPADQCADLEMLCQSGVAT